jgi:hypothetical protein
MADENYIVDNFVLILLLLLFPVVLQKSETK